MIWITRIESTWSRVVYYWCMSEVKEGKLKYSTESIEKTSQTIQLNWEVKWEKLNMWKRNNENTNKKNGTNDEKNNTQKQ